MSAASSRSGVPIFCGLGRAKRKPKRNSWVVQNEDGKYPDIIVEVLSESTRSTDRGKKKAIYEKIFRTPEYFLFDPKTDKLEGYRLLRGRYVPIKPDARGRLPSERLGLSFGLHDDPELDGKVARLFTPDGEMVPIPHEAALLALQEAEQAAAAATEAKANVERAEREERRAIRDRERAVQDKERAVQDKERAVKEKERLAAKLRSLGLDPDAVG